MAMELITLHSSVLNERTTETVNARDLHEFLEIGRDFSNWIKARIEQYGFEEDTDFVVISRSPKRACGNRGATKDYYVSLDMAKELAMVERNEKGKQARRYFIECERQLREQPKLPAPDTLDKYQILNNIARSMGIEQDIAILPAVDVMGLVSQLRHYQRQIASMQTNLHWVDESIERVKTAASRGFGDI